VNQLNNGTIWHDIFFNLLFIKIAYNLIARLLSCSVFFTGIQLKGNRINVKADLLGGLPTSPGSSFGTFLYLVVCGSQTYFFLDGSLFSQSLLSQVYNSAMVASFACVICTAIFNQSNFRLASTGSSVFFTALIARAITLPTSQKFAQGEIRGLGQVLEKECLMQNLASTQEKKLLCNIADGMGMSGLEIFSRFTSKCFL